MRVRELFQDETIYEIYRAETEFKLKPHRMDHRNGGTGKTKEWDDRFVMPLGELVSEEVRSQLYGLGRA
jgi:hypothetical protein